MERAVATLLGCLLAGITWSQQRVVVDAAGKGDFITIQSALNSFSDSAIQPRTIYIRKGIYHEKIFIEKSNVILEGEDRNTTIITAAIARDEWRCQHADDWGVATVNVGANDVSFKNLTVTNSFGFDWKGETMVPCIADSAGQRVLRKDGHQMALRTRGTATRMKAVNCNFRAFGGDTVSPWEVQNGFWYFKDCVMEGGVDFYCPRGWAWAENCEFISHTGPAAIWHDGSAVKDSKTVMMNCRFTGYDGFLLGRYHRDANFFLVNCSFAANMKDAPIYLVPTKNTIRWGQRTYYYNCHREGGNDFKWYQNNLPNGLDDKTITVSWVFNNKWDPVQN